MRGDITVAHFPLLVTVRVKSSTRAIFTRWRLVATMVDDATVYLGGGIMRRIIIIVSGFVLASVLVSLAALSAGAQTAEDSPSQGSFTEGTAGPNEPSLVDDPPPTDAELSEPLIEVAGRPSGNDVVRAAKRYIGTRYRFGACSGSRMSCTCLTKKVFAKFGHKLPMSERGQWSYQRGRKVAKSRLHRGDLVF